MNGYFIVTGIGKKILFCYTYLENNTNLYRYYIYYSQALVFFFEFFMIT